MSYPLQNTEENLIEYVSFPYGTWWAPRTDVGCNTYSTALLIGEKAAIVIAGYFGYSGDALDMKVSTYRASEEFEIRHRL